jgi:hypothetical protein
MNDLYLDDDDSGGAGPFLLLLFLVVLAAAALSVVRMAPDGRIAVSIPLDGVAMPPPPQCDEDGNCSYEWKAEGGVNKDGCIDWIRVLLNRDGCPVAGNEMVKIETAEYQETAELAEAGHNEAWISSVEVEESAQGQGLGRSTWQAGDRVLKLVDSRPVHVFSDIAGWGKSLMTEIDTALILIEEEGLWAYLVR